MFQTTNQIESPDATFLALVELQTIDGSTFGMGSSDPQKAMGK